MVLRKGGQRSVKIEQFLGPADGRWAYNWAPIDLIRANTWSVLLISFYGLRLRLVLRKCNQILITVAKFQAGLQLERQTIRLE